MARTYRRLNSEFPTFLKGSSEREIHKYFGDSDDFRWCGGKANKEMKNFCSSKDRRLKQSVIHDIMKAQDPEEIDTPEITSESKGAAWIFD